MRAAKKAKPVTKRAAQAKADKKLKASSNVHTIYKDKHGTRLPGVTTICGLLNKPGLVPWAYKLGCEGVDMRKYMDKMASIGTLAHQMVMNELKPGAHEIKTAEFSEEVRDLADNCFLSYLQWKKGLVIEPEVLEQPIVCDRLGFGGTFDFLGNVNGEKTLIDFKTGKGIYTEHFYQLAAYNLLLKETSATWKMPTQFGIVNIPRSEDEAFAVKWIGLPDLLNAERVFLALLEVYQSIKAVRI